MSYQETKSRNFSSYCRDGKVALIKKWINDPNVDVNWNYGKPLINLVAGTKENNSKNIELVRMFMEHPKLKTNYESGLEIKGTSIPVSSTNLNDDNATSGLIDKYFRCVWNPITQAMLLKNFEVLDIFSKEYHSRFKFDRVEYLDLLLQSNDDELKDYFMMIPGFTTVFTDCEEKYNSMKPDWVDFFNF